MAQKLPFNLKCTHDPELTDETYKDVLEAFRYVYDHGGVTHANVMQRLSIKHNYACMVSKNTYDYLYSAKLNRTHSHWDYNGDIYTVHIFGINGSKNPHKK